MSAINGLPIPLAPPRSPRKNDGPRPSPNSYFPSLKEMACELDHSDRDSNKTVINIRQLCIIALIDTRFVFFNGTFKIPKFRIWTG